MYEDAITRDCDDYKVLMQKIVSATDTLKQTADWLKPTICNERYLSSREVCALFHITKRTLQEYRDQLLVPYTRFGNKIYYVESAIQKLLEQKHVCIRDEWAIIHKPSLL